MSTNPLLRTFPTLHHRWIINWMMANNRAGWNWRLKSSTYCRTWRRSCCSSGLCAVKKKWACHVGYDTAISIFGSYLCNTTKTDERSLQNVGPNHDSSWKKIHHDTKGVSFHRFGRLVFQTIYTRHIRTLWMNHDAQRKILIWYRQQVSSGWQPYVSYASWCSPLCKDWKQSVGLSVFFG